MLNNFVANTALFFNSFAENVEQKISKVSHKISELEILLSVLEAKLNSIPELEDIKSPIDSVPLTPTPSTPLPPSEPVKAPVESLEAETIAEPEAAAPGPAYPPEYEKFVKQLKFGVPLVVVKNNVLNAGLNPDIMDTIAF